MQEPVYVLHLITCHGRIMPRLEELLFSSVCLSVSLSVNIYFVSKISQELLYLET